MGTTLPERLCPHCKEPMQPNNWLGVCRGCRQLGCAKCLLRDKNQLLHTSDNCEPNKEH